MLVRILLPVLAVTVALISSPQFDTAGTTHASSAAPVGLSTLILGDVDCDQDVDSVDALQGLRGLSGLPTAAACLAEAGDTDCDGDRDSVDSLRVLRHTAALPNSTPVGCPSIGTAVGGAPLLNELLFAPGAGGNSFVELKTAGGEVDPAGLLLVNERDTQILVPNSGPISEEDVMLLEFGGSDFLDDESGFVELRDGNDVLDRVAWGVDQLDGVRLTAGGFLTEFEPGTSIGRAPGSTGPNPSEWVTYAPSLATPGAPNADVGVQVALPLHDAIFESGDVKLNWYPVAGASGYQVDVASEETFSDPHTEQTVTTSSLQLNALPAGEHFWRVQVIDDGGTGGYSPTQSLTVAGASPAVADEEEDVPGVPFIVPHKDTAMLLLEKNASSGDFAWDKAHPDIDPNDPREINNAFLASVAMVNGFLGGNLSQDRMGYELFNGRVSGAERDLAYGDALNDDQGLAVMLFAFEGVDALCSSDSTEIWNFLTDSLAMELPAIGAISSHAVVVTGSRIVLTQEGEGPLTEERFVSVNDPFIGRYDVNFDGQVFQCLWRPAEGTIIGAFDDLGISSDSDGDGIVDFDETARFHTDPNHTDTDRDGLSDKEDLAESIFHPEEGYAADFGFLGDELFPLGSQSRDWDRDQLNKELDCDSDNDGVSDGDDIDSFGSVPIFGTEVPCDLGPDTLIPRIGDSSFTVALCTERADLDPDLLQCPVTFDASMDYTASELPRTVSCAGESQGEFVFTAIGGGVSEDLSSLVGVASLSPTGIAYFDESSTPIFSNPVLVECQLLPPFTFENGGLPVDTVTFTFDLTSAVIEIKDCFPSAHTDCGVP